MKVLRKFSILTRKRIVEYYKSSLKSEKQIRQEYGLTPLLLMALERWYNLYFLNPQKNYYQTQKSKAMGQPRKYKKSSENAWKKALEKENKKLLKEKKELEKNLKWEQLKSQLFEKMIEVAERELELPIRKKFGTKQFEK